MNPDSQDPSPPPDLNAVQLRAWKRKQRILNNGSNRMKLVTGQAKALEHDEEEANERRLEEDAHGNSPSNSKKDTAQDELPKKATEKGDNEIVAEDHSNNTIDSLESESNSVVESASDAGGNEKPSSEEKPDEATKESSDDDNRPKWEKRWEQARSKKGIMSSDAVEELLNQPPPVSDSKDAVEGLRQRKVESSDEKATPKATTPKETSKLAAQAATNQSNDLTPMKVEVLKDYSVVVRRLVLIVMSAFAGQVWINTEYPAARCSGEVDVAGEVPEQLAWSYSNSFPVDFVSGSLVITLMAMQITLMGLLAGYVLLQTGNLKNYISGPKPGSMIAMALPMITAAVGSRAVLVFSAWKEIAKVPVVALEDAMFCIVPFFVTASLIHKYQG